MMKKTLLSIMTMAALVSSATATAETKDIIVSAEIPSVITVKKSSGGDIDSIKLASVPGSTDKYEAKEKIKAHNNGEAVKVRVRSNLELTSTKYPEKKFDELSVTLGGHMLSDVIALPVELKDGADTELVITGKSPAGAETGDTYSGTLELSLETDS
ncbi:alpha-related fimbriae minor subunit 1 [Yersinia mollaretii]|uniref:CS1 type fimbrial major subunit n=2 Tax=Yersinia mollaretii TaxID=33060 RepID=UPI0005DB6DBA|nr:CS1 type fimbrial major subunit [Yersinia mollaretii]PHZ30817.1 hypothetical protein CS537_15530 [Yersinia mollaretii]WQC75054.1 CS1 type fimbrial major subunit [Yersinia mollaretii]CNF35325.1 alpha-related fimbriae minor subunit 1 [Yersinia mollaretii]CQJ25486.1 alpha-related fimbriae minor subunit 1 [Yersinia mollaretii]